MIENRVFIGQFPLQKAIIFENMLFKNNINFESLQATIDGFEIKNIFVKNENATEALTIKEQFEKEEIDNELSNKYIGKEKVKILARLALIIVVIYGFYQLYSIISSKN